MIGERTNVTGSQKFARLIKDEKYEEAVEVARSQVDGGANVIDVNMDEALLDGEAVMTKFLRLIAGEHDVAAVPGDGRQQQVVGHRGRAEVAAGQADRQLDQPQGRRGRVPPPRAAVPLVRHGRRRDGVRRAGAGRRGRRQGPHLPAGVSSCSPKKSASRPRTSSSIRTFSPSPRASRSTTTTRSTSSSRSRGSRRRARARTFPAACRTFRSRSAATTWSARRCTRRSCTTRFRPASTWASSTPASSRCTRRSSRGSRSWSRTCFSIAGRTRPSGWSNMPRRSKGRAGRPPRPTRRGASEPVEERLKHALLKGIVKYIDEDTEEARQKYPSLPGDHRRPADGRHERRRRPVRRRARCSCRRS